SSDMKTINSIVVALDLSDMDEPLLRFADFFAGHFAAKEVHFMHVIPEFVLPDSSVDVVHSIVSPGFHLDEKIEKKMKAEIKATFENRHKAKVKIEVEEGVPFQTLVEKTDETGAELLLLGKKKVEESSGIIPRMVARKVKGAVCFVSENSEPIFKNLLVPVDFSAYSVKALQAALDLRGNRKGVKITALHIVDYPPTALYLTRNYGMLAHDWRDRVKEHYDHFLSKHQLSPAPFEPIFLQNDYFNIAQHIVEYAANNGVDCIVAGAKGHSALDDLFLGSVTEKLVTLEDEIPVVVVR
ncbi:MAG: universal stress protein, partial [Bacteroidota bacterium]